MLGVPDAAELPAVPGLGYLRTDPATLVRFATAYVSGSRTARSTSAGNGIVPFSIAEVPLPDDDAVSPIERSRASTWRCVGSRGGTGSAPDLAASPRGAGDARRPPASPSRAARTSRDAGRYRRPTA